MVNKELKLVLETKAIVREDEKFKFAENLSKYCCPPSADLGVGNANDRNEQRGRRENAITMGFCRLIP
jgi:hypothetical protein